MSVFTRLASGTRAVDNGNGFQRSLPKVATQLVGYAAPGLPQTLDIDARRALTIGYYGSLYSARCVRMIAQTIAALPVKVGPDPNNPGTVNTSSLLARRLGPPPGGPAPMITGRALLEWSIIQYLICGRYAWETTTLPGDASRTPQGLWPILAEALQPIQASSGGTSPWSGFKVVRGATTATLPTWRVHYAWRPSQVDWWQPESMVQSMSVPLEVQASMDAYLRGFARNGLTGGHLVVTPQFADAQVKAQFEQNFLSAMTGSQNAGRVAFTQVSDTGQGSVPETQILPISTTGRDAQLVEQIREVRDAILIGWGVPLSMLGEAAGRTFANADQEHTNFWQGTIMPLVAQLQDGLNVSLAPRFGADVLWFDLTRVDALRPTSSVFAAEAGSALVAAGIVRAHEVRAGIGLAPDIPAEVGGDAAAQQQAAAVKSTGGSVPLGAKEHPPPGWVRPRPGPRVD